jgi:hypothetical protein
MSVITIISTISKMAFEKWNGTFELKQHLSYVNQISDTSLSPCVYVLCGVAFRFLGYRRRVGLLKVR